MTYIERYTEEQAISLVAELIAEGFRAYFLKNNQDSYSVRYWV